jgi:DNA-binding PadR family transcriptional regulator
MKPMSGYDLKRTFDASVRHFWSADQAAIYRTLSDLQADGLVTHERIEQQARPDRKVFHITPPGVHALDDWLAEPAPPVARREPLLVKLFFLSRLSPDALRGVLDAELAAVHAELSTYSGIVAEVSAAQPSLDPQTALGPLVTLSNGVQFALAYRDWLHALQQQLDGGTLSVPSLLERLRTALAS